MSLKGEVVAVSVLVINDAPAATVVIGSPAQVVQKFRWHKAVCSDDVQ